MRWVVLSVLALLAAGSIAAAHDYHRHGYSHSEGTVLFQFVQPPTTPEPVVVVPGVTPAPVPLTAEQIREIIRQELAAKPVPAAPDRVKLVQTAASYLAASCAECHSQPKPKGGVSLFTAAGAFDPKVDWKVMYAAVKTDDMPKNRPPMAEDGKKVLAALAGEKR
jgi:hypothetical protein